MVLRRFFKYPGTDGSLNPSWVFFFQIPRPPLIGSFLIPEIFKYPELMGLWFRIFFKCPELMGITKIKYPPPHWSHKLTTFTCSGCVSSVGSWGGAVLIATLSKEPPPEEELTNDVRSRENRPAVPENRHQMGRFFNLIFSSGYLIFFLLFEKKEIAIFRL
jgi:hypothetical protein